MLGRSKKEELSSRQMEVLNLLRRGLTNGEICRTLNISENTVKTHLANIYRILEVTNRAEAAALDLSEMAPPKANVSNRQDIVVAFEKNEALAESPLAYSVVCAVIEALHQYHIFKIRVIPADEINRDSDYQIKVATTHGESDTLFTTLYQDESANLLWSHLQKIGADTDPKVLAIQLAIQIFRNMKVSAADKFSQEPELRSNWWYATCFASVKMETRNKDLFQQCISSLQSIIDAKKGNLYLTHILANVYYTGIVEHWVEAEPYTAKIGKLACDAMRDTPYSSYSQFMMALYNILIGNKSDAIAYFVQILMANPQDVLARRYLTQIYLLVGMQEEAMQQLEENSRYVPDLNHQPFQLIAKSFIYLLQGNYDKCELMSQQILMIHPETPFARLFMVVCNNYKGNTRESQKHLEKFKEYHPNFHKTDVEHLLKGVSAEQKDGILRLLENLD